jgi:hypothetical protein
VVLYYHALQRIDRLLRLQSSSVLRWPLMKHQPIKMANRISSVKISNLRTTLSDYCQKNNGIMEKQFSPVYRKVSLYLKLPKIQTTCQYMLYYICMIWRWKSKLIVLKRPKPHQSSGLKLLRHGVSNVNEGITFLARFWFKKGSHTLRSLLTKSLRKQVSLLLDALQRHGRNNLPLRKK